MKKFKNLKEYLNNKYPTEHIINFTINELTDELIKKDLEKRKEHLRKRTNDIQENLTKLKKDIYEQNRNFNYGFIEKKKDVVPVEPVGPVHLEKRNQRIDDM